MIVDDSLVIRVRLKKIFKELNHNVIAEAKTGKEAIEIYSKKIPDIVTMDITMPDMDGITAVKYIKNKYPDAKIIMVTSHGQENMVRDALISGARGYILKPIQKVKLKESLNKIFHGLEDETELTEDFFND